MKYLTLISLLYFVTEAKGQMKDFVQKYAIKISSISPDSTNFDDLESVGKAIDNSQIVLLGEQDHSDAATFLAKTRLVKYLHEKKGFNVLAFESDFFGLNEGFQTCCKDAIDINAFLKDNILSLWSYCDACDDLLYNYIPSTFKSKSPLYVAGFDNQTSYDYSRKYLVHDLDSVLRNLSLPIVKQSNYFSEILPLINDLVSKYWFQRPEVSAFINCTKFLTIIKHQISDQLDSNNFWNLVVDNLISFSNELLNLKTEILNSNTISNTIRDSQMFLNMKWLIQAKYPKQKIIVWAANRHIAKYEDKKVHWMGKRLSDDSTIGAKFYSIGFTSYSGESGRINEKKFRITKPKNASLETWVNPSFKYAFIDFAEFNKLFPNSNVTFEMRKWNYMSSKNEWNKIFDGVFYIREMYPCNHN